VIRWQLGKWWHKTQKYQPEANSQNKPTKQKAKVSETSTIN